MSLIQQAHLPNVVHSQKPAASSLKRELLAVVARGMPGLTTASLNSDGNLSKALFQILVAIWFNKEIACWIPEGALNAA